MIDADIVLSPVPLSTFCSDTICEADDITCINFGSSKPTTAFKCHVRQRTSFRSNVKKSR